MAVRTVTVDLRLDAGSYLAIARSVVRANQAIDRSYNDMAASAAAAGAASSQMGRDLAQMGRRARLTERRMHELREEIARLQAQAAMGIPNMGMGAGGRGMGGMMGMFSNPMVLGAAGIAVAAAGPAIGSMVGGLILTALGTISLAPGIISALKDDDVQHAFIEFGDFAGEEFKKYGNAFQVPLIDAAEHFSDRFASISPKVLGVLSEMAVAVKPLSEGLTGFLEKAGPGVAAGLRGSLPVLKALAEELPEAGAALGFMFKQIGAGSEGAADGIVTLLKLLELGAVALGGWILYLEKIYALAGNLPDGLKGLLGPGAALMGGGETKSITPIGAEVGESIDGVRYKADSARYAVAKLAAEIAGAANNTLDARAANREFQEALDGLKESIDANGRSMDITTQKGRDNNAALDEAFRKAYAVREANLAMGMSIEQANADFNASVEAIRRAAYAAGFNKAQVDALIASLRAIPTTVTSNININYTTRFRTIGSPNYNRAPGTQVAFRDGGITPARDGLMSGAGIYTGGKPIVKFAEAGTGREAYIAQNAPASRSLAIANTAAGWHGGQVVPKGMGGVQVVMVRPAVPTNANREVVNAITGQIRLDVQHQSRGDVQRHFGSAGRP